MAKYRKKPVVIEAATFNGRVNNTVMWGFAPDWLVAATKKNPREVGSIQVVNDEHAEIKTLEGVMTADVGDYIIQGVKGELYPCKPDIFAATYDDADAKPDDVTTLPSQFQIGALVLAQGQRTEVTAVLFTQSSVFYQVVGRTDLLPSADVEPCVEAAAPKPTIF